MIQPTDAFPDILASLKSEWARAVNDNQHPFRYVVLSTQGDAVMSRYVVLRKFDDDLSMIIYTDYRSRKVSQIKGNDQVQMLFYNAPKGLQVMVDAKAEIHHGDELAESHWKKVLGNGRRAYTTSLAPGEVIATPQQGHEWMEGLPDDYFTVIRIKPVSIEALQLNGTEHLRAAFHSKDGWRGQWLVP